MANTDTWDEFLAKLDNSVNGEKDPFTPLLFELRTITNPQTYKDIGDEAFN